MTRSIGWYARRLQGMSAAEVLHRVGDQGRQRLWSRRREPLGVPQSGPVPGLLPGRTFTATVPAQTKERVPVAARHAVVAAADRILAGDLELLGWPRPDLADPDWFLDPVTGRRAPQDVLSFRIDHRDEAVTGNVKAVWELSRHHHLTVLAAAWWLTHDDRYAEVVARQLRSWWTANPFLSGVHWTSGIELGVRLTSWVWVRRLLDEWPGVADLFEENQDALRQLRRHQEYLAAFRSRGSSANNHVVAEAVGRLVAACAFPWFRESDHWRAEATAELEEQLAANTFPSGLNREQATDYHRFVTELGIVALAEADRAGHPLGQQTRTLLTSSLDAAAAILDGTGRPPRQGDGDEGRALIVDDPDLDPWAALLSAGAAVVGPRDWWPVVAPSASAVLLSALAARVDVPGRPTVAPAAFPDAGLYLLRTRADDGPEIWCRCDGGPHGFLSIAAHAHADALSIEVRCDGVDLLADPGTFCYHGDRRWRSYFRSTAAHNTIVVDGASQSLEAGPFLWAGRTDSATEGVDLGGSRQSWSAHHLGYGRSEAGLRHHRRVELDADDRTLVVEDTLSGGTRHTASLSWHLGPQVSVEVSGAAATLSWDTQAGRRTATLHLPEQLVWSAHRGEEDPIRGWYSPRFGARVPSTTLVGDGAWTGVVTLRTVLDLSEVTGDAVGVTTSRHVLQGEP